MKQKLKRNKTIPQIPNPNWFVKCGPSSYTASSALVASSIATGTTLQLDSISSQLSVLSKQTTVLQLHMSEFITLKFWTGNLSYKWQDHVFLTLRLGPYHQHHLGLAKL